MRRIALIQHEIDSPPGTSLPWLFSRGFQVIHRRMYLGEPLPRLEEFDDMILCGGSMNVDEEHLNPWMKEEKDLIRANIERGGRMVGLCLGGQLLAEALGAKVRPHNDWEVGWHSIQLGLHKTLAGFQAPMDLKMFQWHRYVFEIPEGAKRIASNSWWENQAFIWNDQVLGFQFHPETDLNWNRECALDRGLPTTGQCQSADDILKLGPLYQPRMEAWFHQVLESFFIR